MDLKANPFYEVYVGEKVSGQDFVRIFSECLVDSVEALYLPGNVALVGVQGSGKSMLLSLLKPEVRIAYHRAGVRFPLGASRRKFIGAGINLNLSNAIEFSQRSIYENGEWTSPYHFGDFVNYWICNDVLSSIEKYVSCGDGAIAAELGLTTDEGRLDDFARQLAEDDCWFGFLSDVTDYQSLRKAFKKRITAYRAYLTYNSREIPVAMRETKTGIGVPIARMVRILRETGVAREGVEIFIQIDQYEELCRLESAHNEPNWAYREVVNKALAIRDPAVSYKIGTRKHAWWANLNTYKYPYRLEEHRDYVRIDLHQVLKRRENAKSWIFPEFAQDVFRRRLTYAGFKIPDKADLLKVVFGDSFTPEEKARLYAADSAHRAVQLDDNWPEWWKEYLLTTAKANPLSARLAEGWALQKGPEEGIRPEWVSEEPWLKREWWKKERNGQALIQIASRCRGVQFWCGKDDILQLCGGNILVFLAMCQTIWSAWLRTEKIRSTDLEELKVIDPYQQTYGVAETSTAWVNKIIEEGGRTSDRLSFIKHIGETFYKKLINDRKLTYPGHNGFSLLNDSIDGARPIKTFLNELTDYGNLVEDEHTTRNKDRRPRTKWYLHPIYCPHFRIPYQRTKEPYYVEIEQVGDWLHDAGIMLFDNEEIYVLPRSDPEPSARTNGANKKRKADSQLGFDFSEDE